MPSRRLLATLSALVAALVLFPAAARADEAPQGYDLGDWYVDAAEDASDGAALQAGYPGVPAISPREVSEEMTYHIQHESGRNYDQGFAPGDGYNALGFYQFDRRYSLIGFLKACVNYDAAAYAMFVPVIERAAEVQDPSVAMAYRRYDEQKGEYYREYTELGSLVEKAWHDAYAADPDGFSGLQNDYAYQSYYEPAASWFAARGIDLDGRADCVKGLVWGLSSLFGLGGRLDHTYTYQVDSDGDGSLEGEEVLDTGIPYNGAKFFYVGSGVSASMSDEQFVTALCDYVVANVSKYCYGKSQWPYWAGWQSRYRAEKAECLQYLAGRPQDKPTAAFTDVVAGSWYADSVSRVFAAGLMHGYSGGSVFGVGKTMTRAELAEVLYNLAASKGQQGSYSASVNTTGMADLDVTGWYTQAANWAVAKGVVAGANGRFMPNDPVTFEQAVLIVGRSLAGADPAPSGDPARLLAGFEDAGAVSPWAANALAWSVEKGFVTGYTTASGRVLGPQEALPRERAAAILVRMLGL